MEKNPKIDESLSNEHLPDEYEVFEEITDEKIDEVAGGLRCAHEYKKYREEITQDGIKREYFTCLKCGQDMKRSSRVK